MIKISKIQSTVLGAYISVMTSPVMAQVQAQSAGSSWLTNKANIFYGIVTAIAGTLMATAWTMAGYKFMFVENTKLTDIKGLFIGGLCCAGAATWSYTMLN